MTFTSTTASLKHNDGLSKDDIEQGFEILPMPEVKKTVANNRLGLTSPWVKVDGDDDMTEWSD